MAAVITRSAHPDALWPGVHTIFGLAYDEWPEVFSEIFEEQDAELATERLVEATGFAVAPIKPEGSPIAYDTDGEGYVTTATHNVYALGFQVTREELEDDLYAEVAGRRANSLAFSMRTTIEQAHANLLLNAFAGGPVYGDGVSLCNASHPTKSGNQSNLPTTNADLSEASLEDMTKRVYLAQNSRGLPINLRPDSIIVSAADMFNAERILQSQLRSGTANNDINAVKNMKLFPGGVIVNPYLGVEATQAWFMKTMIPSGTGLLSLWRRYPELERDADFDTENAKAKATARFVPIVADWRALYGTPGV